LCSYPVPVVYFLPCHLCPPYACWMHCALKARRSDNNPRKVETEEDEAEYSSTSTSSSTKKQRFIVNLTEKPLLITAGEDNPEKRQGSWLSRMIRGRSPSSGSETTRRTTSKSKPQNAAHELSEPDENPSRKSKSTPKDFRRLRTLIKTQEYDEACELLSSIDVKDQVNDRDNDELTLLSLAIKRAKRHSDDYGLERLCNWLIRDRASTEIKDSLGRRPLHLAALRSLVSIATLLIVKECEVNPEDGRLLTPYDHVLKDISYLEERHEDTEARKYRQMAELLVDNGARTHAYLEARRKADDRFQKHNQDIFAKGHDRTRHRRHNSRPQ